MTKKIILLMMCLIILASCGRKGDPEYQTTQHDNIMQKV